MKFDASFIYIYIYRVSRPRKISGPPYHISNISGELSLTMSSHRSHDRHGFPIHSVVGISEKRAGNIATRRLLVNPYGPNIQAEFCDFSRGK